ncbi:M23 family metallopeptidase [Leptothoe kymatousa]|uniref:Peptidoglycan DD-metalloendopeptidase family protein n=1 Tax=Leptothoe kymatousa TAU-MAC 1615 TaxID=2364775 RepID=A0ABS5XZS8_9CYAN|nr:M23 family metallopeptidase [Leptothoe kymatousa]MBT9311076.1 peptidoglycan DD-metalloendopeptidase family protein [Leptothoe kymatousa TAU-MAC 1615]
MAASDNTFVRIAQKSFSHGAPLLKVSAFAAAGLLGTQAVLAQTDGAPIELAIPSVEAPEPTPVVEAPAPIVAPPPVVIEPTTPVTPTDVVPSSIQSEAPEPAAVDYGAVFVEPSAQQLPPTLDSLKGELPGGDASQVPAQVPAVEFISPVDYGSAQVDPTDYNVGATMPDVVISERSSGCQFSVSSGSSVAQAGCGQLAAPIGNGASVAPAPAQQNVAEAVMNIPGVQKIAGLTTAASRDYYNEAAKTVVNLQLGEKFIFPLTMPAPLTSLFGWRMHPIFGAQRFHTGTDIGAPLGTPVVATQAGRVELADATGGYGLMVVLRHHDDTLESRYAHLARLLVRAGEWVEQGEVIGLVGSTGNSTGPHLHFELRQRTDSGWAVLNPDALVEQTLGTLTAALGNSAAVLASKPIVPSPKVSKDGASQDSGAPFRPAQPLAN